MHSTHASDAETTIDRLLAQMQGQGDFPAVGRFLAEVTTALRLPNVSGQQIANLILKDFALTNALLRTVNSALFPSPGGRRISTVSHAVLLLGVDTVANLAVGLRLLEHFNGPGDLRTVRTLMIEGLLTGVNAREIAQTVANVVPEEAFICGLMNDLGRLSVAFYLPETYADLTHTAARSGITINAAARTVLGAPLESIGQAVASAWRFPDHICGALHPLPGAIGKPVKGGAPLQLIVAFARELTILLADAPSDDRAQRITALRDRFDKALPVRAAHLEQLVSASTQRLNELLATLHVSQRSFSDELRPTPPPTDDTTPAASAAPSADHADSSLVLHAVEEITQALGGEYALNDVLMMVLEAMYRGMGFAHAILFLVTPQRDALRARCLLGPDADRILDHVRVPLTDGAGALRDVIADQHELVCAAPLPPLGLPTAVLSALAPHAVAALPIVVKGTAIGALYVDRRDPAPVTAAELRSLRLLRDQAVLAVRLCRAS